MENHIYNLIVKNNLSDNKINIPITSIDNYYVIKNNIQKRINLIEENLSETQIEKIMSIHRYDKLLLYGVDNKDVYILCSLGKLLYQINLQFPAKLIYDKTELQYDHSF